MSDPNSRYAALETATLELVRDDGGARTIAYKRRRFIPPADEMTPLGEHTVAQGDRLDRLTAKYFGDPTQFWRVCDANRVLRPDELVDELGTTILICIPATTP